MTRTDRPLDNPINWSFRVGSLFGISVRVHIAFLLCAVFLVWMEQRPQDVLAPHGFGTTLVNALGSYFVLFAIVLLHEFGHCYGARKSGGTADEVLLWPLGGLAYVQPRPDPSAHFLTALCGPLVNIIICMVTSAVLVGATGSLGAVPWNPFHPLVPLSSAFPPSGWLYWVTVTFGISYFLLIVNLLPIFPFDGGRLLQAWLWTSRGQRSSIEIACGTGMIGAILIGLVALFTEQPWLPLLIAVYGYMECWQTRRRLRESEYLLQSGFSVEDPYGLGLPGEEERRDPQPGFFARRRARKAAEFEERRRKEETEHQEAVDRILRKVSLTGLSSLTPQERKVLERETQEQRSRQSGL